MNIVEPIRDKKALKRIEKALEKQSQRDLLIFLLGINCGLRISDILNLNVENVKDKTYIDIIEKRQTKAFSYEDFFFKNSHRIDVEKSLSFYLYSIIGWKELNVTE